MWCSSCQQDVPAVATPDDDKVRCTRCHEEVSARRADCGAGEDLATQIGSSRAQLSEVPPWAFVEKPPIQFDAWRWDEDLFEAERLLRSYQVATPYELTSSLPATTNGNSAPVEARVISARRSPQLTAIAWTLLSLGVTASVFGGVLLGWSVWSGQQLLWSVGLPFALGGQATLVLGLVFQLDVLWQRNGDTNVALEQLDGQLGQLRHATGLLEAPRVDASHAFSMHGSGLEPARRLGQVPRGSSTYVR